MEECKKTILFIMHMPPPVHGASMVGQYIHDSELVNSEFCCHYINLAIAKDLKDIGKGGLSKLNALCHKLKEIWSKLRTVNPDIIYITPNTAGGPFYKDFIIVQLCKLFSVNVYLHLHNKGVMTRQDRWLDNLLYRFFFKNVNVILLGDSLYKDIEKYVPRKNVYICPNGIIDMAKDFKHNIGSTLHILWLTNIMRTKGIIEYLDALKLLKMRGCNFVADFVGGITAELSSADFMREIDKRGLNDVCVYHGPVYGEEKYKFYQRADIFVLPSYTEAFPLTILEAMQFGVPVVASNVGGVCEEVIDGDNGFLLGGEIPFMSNTFRPAPMEIAEKLEILLKNDVLRRNLGCNGRRRYESNFTMPIFIERFVKAFI